jgi:hypothetical protein
MEPSYHGRIQETGPYASQQPPAGHAASYQLRQGAKKIWGGLRLRLVREIAALHVLTLPTSGGLRVADNFDPKKLTSKVNEIAEVVSGGTHRRGPDPAEAQAAKAVDRSHDLASHAVNLVRLVSSRHLQVVWSDIAAQELSHARQIEREAQLEQFQDRFHEMLIRHLGILDKLVKAAQRRVQEQAERVRLKVERGTDATVSRQLLAKMEGALTRHIAYRERLSREVGSYTNKTS